MELKTKNQIDVFIDAFKSKYQTSKGVSEFFKVKLSETQEIEDKENFHKKAMDFIEEYKKEFAGSNALYGYLYHSFLEFKASVNDLDLMDIYSKINKK